MQTQQKTQSVELRKTLPLCFSSPSHYLICYCGYTVNFHLRLSRAVSVNSVCFHRKHCSMKILTQDIGVHASSCLTATYDMFCFCQPAIPTVLVNKTWLLSCFWCQCLVLFLFQFTICCCWVVLWNIPVFFFFLLLQCRKHIRALWLRDDKERQPNSELGKNLSEHVQYVDRCRCVFVCLY